MSRTPIQPDAGVRVRSVIETEDPRTDLPGEVSAASSGACTGRDSGRDCEGEDTPRRILRAAGRVFAEQGYRRATVRRICECAGANVAAINYYYGDKRTLYEQVLRTALSVEGDGRVGRWQSGDAATPRERLRDAIGSMLRRPPGTDDSAIAIRLIARELVDPTPGLEQLLEVGVRPLVTVLVGIVEELSGARCEPETARRCAGSILAQCLFSGWDRSISAFPSAENEGEPAGVDELADHIAEFSLAGISAVTGREFT